MNHFNGTCQGSDTTENFNKEKASHVDIIVRHAYAVPSFEPHPVVPRQFLKNPESRKFPPHVFHLTYAIHDLLTRKDIPGTSTLESTLRLLSIPRPSIPLSILDELS